MITARYMPKQLVEKCLPVGIFVSDLSLIRSERPVFGLRVVPSQNYVRHCFYPTRLILGYVVGNCRGYQPPTTQVSCP